MNFDINHLIKFKKKIALIDLNEKKITYEVSNEIDLTENLLKDFSNNINTNNKNVEELNDYGEKILQLTANEVLNLKNEI